MRRLTVVFVIALLAASCGGDEVSERIAEGAIGGDADVEISGDGDDFSLSVESDDESIQIGSGAEAPGALSVPIPDGGDVTASFEDANSASASAMYAGDRYDEIVAFYTSWTAGTGDEWQTQTSTFEIEGETQRSSQWNTIGNEFFILVTDCVDIDTGEFSAVCITVNQNL